MTTRYPRHAPRIRGLDNVLESANDGAWMIAMRYNYLQRDLPAPRGDTVATFGAKSTARRFLTRDKAERFILDVLGHSHDYRVVHLLPKGTIARRERRTVAEAVKRVLLRYDEECQISDAQRRSRRSIMHEAWWLEALGEELA